MTVRTRFAPSPTGYLHIGGARTALYCYLFAKKHNGQFILRVEDTDRERSTDESVQAILDGMSWLGLACDEGPFFQTERFERYREVIEQLIDSSHAYRCYCSQERLSALRDEQMKAKVKPRYDGHCRTLTEAPSEGAPYVIRFRNPEDGAVTFEDAVKGYISVSNQELDDLIIARTDGTPTYNLTVVVDDWDMGITHVIRGDDHVNNTPRQVNILKALNADLPIYAHLPMIVGQDGKRLSKRHNAVSVMHYKEAGYLPEALLNYLVRLGWSHGDQEVFSMDEMVQHFSFEGVNNSSAAFDEDKLNWLNQQYIKDKPPSELVDELQYHFKQLGVELENGPNIELVISAQQSRVKTLKEMAEISQYFYQDELVVDKAAAEKHLGSELVPVFQQIKTRFETLETWEADELKPIIVDTAKEHDLKMGKVMMPMRVAVTGNTNSPSLDLTLELLGKETSLTRLNNALKAMEQAA